MNKTKSPMARPLAQAVSAFELRAGSHLPRSMTVVLSDHTLVITLRETLSPIEHIVAQCSNDAAQLREFHGKPQRVRPT